MLCCNLGPAWAFTLGRQERHAPWGSGFSREAGAAVSHGFHQSRSILAFDKAKDRVDTNDIPAKGVTHVEALSQH